MPSMKQRTLASRMLALVVVGLACATTAIAAGPSGVKGRVTGYDKLVLEAYQEAMRPDAKRWSWREPSAFVGTQYRTPSAIPHRDICVAIVGQSNATPFELMAMSITGGRIYPSTIVIPPGSKLQFKNNDPFTHRLYVVGNAAWRAEDLRASGSREWTAPNGSARFEFRDELFPSVRAYVVVDPQVAQFAYPKADGQFTANVAAGDYILRAYFGGKPVSKPMSITVKDRATTDLREPLALTEGESK